jgi:hypothetical protein
MARWRADSLQSRCGNIWGQICRNLEVVNGLIVMRGGSAAGSFAFKYSERVQCSGDGAAFFVVYGDFDYALANSVLGGFDAAR